MINVNFVLTIKDKRIPDRQKTSRRKDMLTKVIVAFLIGISTATADEDQASSKINKLCDLDYYLEKLEGALESKLTSHQSANQALTAAARKYRLAAAAAHDIEEHCLLRALEAAATDRKEANLRSATVTYQAVAAAIKEIRQQRQATAGLIALANLKLTADLANGAEQAGGAGHVINTDIKAAITPSQHCSHATQTSETSFGTTEPAPLELKAVRYVAEPDPGKMTRASHLQLTFAGSCSHGSEGKTSFATAATGCTGAATNNNPTIVNAPDAAGEQIQKQAIFVGGDAGGACLPTNENKDKRTHYGEYYADKICKAITARTDSKGMPTLAGEELAQDTVIQQHTAACLPQFRSLTEPTNSDKNTELVNFLKNAFGKGTSGFDSKFKNLADKKMKHCNKQARKRFAAI
uniref:Variant surface glycoprotein 1125.2632 n=1 Tax=Trypanosoma brucei TaxID=5691 RepID=A0A1J0R8D7_9TRYP|nr:variant surface glycoprotein 1125.2632 [Trypanosoma brucei]